MNFLKELKKKSMREAVSSLIPGLICLVLTVLIIYGNMRFFKSPVSIHSISGDSIEETGRVSIQDYLPLGEFAESDDGSYYYAILTYDGDDLNNILPCEVNREIHLELDQAIDDINADLESVVLPELNCVSAKFEKEAVSYYEEFLYDYDISGDPEDNLQVRNFLISQKKGGSTDIVMALVFIVIFAVITAVLIWRFIKAAAGLNQKALLRYAKTTGSEQVTLGQLETFYQSTPEIYSVRMSEKWLLFQSRGESVLLEADQLVWIYKHIVKKKYMLVITTSKTVEVVFGTSDKIKHLVSVKNESEADALIASVMQRYPNVMPGYSKELEKLWDKEGPSAMRRTRQSQLSQEPYSD